MAAKVRAVGAGKFKAEVQGIRETQATLRDLLRGVANESDLSPGQKNAVVMEAHRRLQLELGEAAGLIRDAARSNASASGWSRAVVAAIFRYSDLKQSERKRQRGALAGIRTGAPTLGRAADLRSGPKLGRRVNKEGLFLEWRAGYQMGPRKKGRITATAGRLVGMSLGRVMETGTKNNRATHAFQRAVRAKRGEVLRRAAEGWLSVVKFIAAKHGKVAA